MKISTAGIKRYEYFILFGVCIFCTLSLCCTLQVNAADIEITSAVTTQQNIPENQSILVQGSGSVETSTLNTEAIKGWGDAGDEGGNTVTLESGALVKTTRPADGTDDYSHAVRVYGYKRDNSVTGLAGGGLLTGGASNIIDIQEGSFISTTGLGPYGIKAYSNNSITAAGTISTTGDYGGCIGLLDNNSVNVSGTLTTLNSFSCGIKGYDNNEVNVSGSITTEGKSGDGISFSGKNNSITISGSITTSGKNAEGVYIYGEDDDYNNRVILSGSITTSGESSAGIKTNEDKQSVDVTGSITTSGITSYGISIGDNSTLNFGGSVKTSGNEATAVYAYNKNALSLNGTIATSGTGAHGVCAGGYGNSVVAANSISTIGAEAHAVFSRGDGHVANISGNVSAIGSNAYALASGHSAGVGESNTFHLLGGVSLTGGIHNGDSNDDETSYLTFGYAKVSDKADLSSPAVDPVFSLTLDGSITSDSTGNWDSYFAGGTVTLNGSINTFRKIFIGGASFDGATVPDGNNGAGSTKTVDLDAIVGATAELNVTNAISTIDTIAIGTGSIYNLSGTHTHTGTDITVSGSGLIDLAGGGNFINNATGGAQAISNLNVSSGTGTLSGSNAFDTVTNADIDGIFNFGATADTTFAATNLSGTLNNNSVDNLTLTDLTVDAGSTGILSGNGAGILTVTNSPAISGTLKVNRNVIFSSNIGSISANGILSGSGNITGNVTTGGNGGSLKPVDTLTVTGDVTVDSGDTLDLDISGDTATKLSATGIVDMTDSTVNITGTAHKIGINHTIIEAGAALNNLEASDVAIVNRPVLLDFNTTIDATTLKVQVTQKANGCNKAADGGVNTGISTTLDNLFLSHSITMDGIFDTLNSLQSNNEVNNAMSQLQANNITGSISQSSLTGIDLAAGAMRMQFTSFRMGNVAAAMSSTFSGSGSTAAIEDTIADADTLDDAYTAYENDSTGSVNYKQWTGFARAFGGFGQQGSGVDSTGYDYGNAGVMFGLDYAFSSELRIGGILGCAYNRSNLYNSLGNGMDTTIRLGSYASYSWDKLFVDIAPTVGIHLMETNRNITFMNTSAKGERTSFDFNLLSSVGYEFKLPKEVLLTPSYSLSFTTLYDPQYIETGASGGANLRINEHTTYSLVQNLKLKFGRLFRVDDNLSLLPEVWGGWEHEYLNTGGEVTSAFAGAPSQSWKTEISTIAQNRAVFGCGLTGLVNDSVSVYGRFNQKLWDKGFDTNFTLGIKVFF